MLACSFHSADCFHAHCTTRLCLLFNCSLQIDDFGPDFCVFLMKTQISDSRFDKARFCAETRTSHSERHCLHNCQVASQFRSVTSDMKTSYFLTNRTSNTGNSARNESNKSAPFQRDNSHLHPCTTSKYPSSHPFHIKIRQFTNKHLTERTAVTASSVYAKTFKP